MHNEKKQDRSVNPSTSSGRTEEKMFNISSESIPPVRPELVEGFRERILDQ